MPPLLLGVRKLVSPKGGIPLEKEPQGTLGGTHERDSGGSGDFDREEKRCRRYGRGDRQRIRSARDLFQT